MEIVKFRQNEYDTIRATALAKYKREVLGKEPRIKEVRRTIPNPFTVNTLEIIAFVMLIVLTIFTSIKMSLVALPFVDNMAATLSQHIYIDPNFIWWFRVAGVVLFVFLATPGLIYFKLLSDERVIKDRIKDTQHYKWSKRLSLSYLTPRLPAMLVYIIVGWMVYWSSQLPGTPFEQYLSVIAEVALAQLVGAILAKRAEFNRVVHTAYKAVIEEHRERTKNYASDRDYLRILYHMMREKLISMERKDTTTKTVVHPNAWLEDAEGDVVDAYLEVEYRRLTGGYEFANRITSVGIRSNNVPTSIVTNTKRNGSTITSKEDRIKPPNGVQWNMEDLYTNIRSRGITKYTRTQLRQDYAPKFGTEQLWSNGLKERFQ